MKTYKMIVKTETTDERGRNKTTTETIPHLLEEHLDERRHAARFSAPLGSTRTIEVVEEV